MSGRDDGKSADNPPEKIEKKSNQGGSDSSGGWNSGQLADEEIKSPFPDAEPRDRDGQRRHHIDYWHHGQDRGGLDLFSQ